MNAEGKNCGQDGENVKLNIADRWIISRLQQVQAEAAAGFQDYRFDLTSQALYNFVWDEYCSWYLELSKVVLTDSNSSEQALRGTRRTLVTVLEALLRLLHPIIPFITEAIWQRVAPLANKSGDTIMLQPYPVSESGKIDPQATEEMQWVMAVVTAVRNVRGERDIQPGKQLPVLLQDGSDNDRAFLDNNRHYLLALAKMESITWLDTGDHAPEAVMALIGNMKVLLPLGTLIDKQAEMKRLKKDMEKNKKNLDMAKTKLANADFVARAPKHVVEQEQHRVKEFEAVLANLQTQLDKVENLPG
jgi:valyl-tRNA synthetase